MAEKKTIEYIIQVDADTGDVVKVKNAIDKVNKAAKKLPKTVDKSATSFSNLGSIVGKLGVIGFFGGIAVNALKSSRSFENFQRTIENIASTVVEDFGPALDLIFNGLSGLVSLVGTLAKVIKNNAITAFKALTKVMRGDFKGAVEEFKEGVGNLGDILVDGINVAGQRASGALQETLSGQANILRKSAIIAIKDLSLTNEERLAIIVKVQKDINEVVEKSAEFRNKSEGEREKARLEFIESLSGTEAQLRTSIETQRLAREEEAGRARLELAQLQAEELMEDTEATTEERLEALAEALRLEIELIEADAEKKNSTQETLQNRLLVSRIKFNQRVKAINKSARDEELKGEIKKAQAILAVELAAAKALVKLAFDAGMGQKTSARDVAKTVTKTVGDAAAAQIMANAAAGASKEIATKGLAGLPKAALILAKGALLAAGVAALTGALVRNIGIGGGGGGEEEPAPVEIQEPFGAGDDIVGEGAEVAGAPPGDRAPAGGIVINISGAELLDDEAVIQNLREELGREAAR